MSAAPTKDPPPTLLTLPPEIKNQIYRYILIREEPIHALFNSLLYDNWLSLEDEPHDSTRYRETLTLQRSILLVCRRARDEAGSIYYGENTFLVYSPRPEAILPFLRIVGKRNLGLMRRLYVDFAWSYSAALREANVNHLFEATHRTAVPEREEAAESVAWMTLTSLREWRGVREGLEPDARQKHVVGGLVREFRERVEEGIKGCLGALGEAGGGWEILSLEVPGDEGGREPWWGEWVDGLVVEEGKGELGLEGVEWVQKEWFLGGLGGLGGVKRLRVGGTVDPGVPERVRTFVEGCDGLDVEELVVFASEEAMGSEEGYFEGAVDGAWDVLRERWVEEPMREGWVEVEGGQALMVKIEKRVEVDEVEGYEVEDEGEGDSDEYERPKPLMVQFQNLSFREDDDGGLGWRGLDMEDIAESSD